MALSSLAPPHVHCHLHVTPLPDPSQSPLVLTHPQQACVRLYACSAFLLTSG